MKAQLRDAEGIAELVLRDQWQQSSLREDTNQVLNTEYRDQFLTSGNLEGLTLYYRKLLQDSDWYFDLAYRENEVVGLCYGHIEDGQACLYSIYSLWNDESVLEQLGRDFLSYIADNKIHRVVMNSVLPNDKNRCSVLRKLGFQEEGIEYRYLVKAEVLGATTVCPVTGEEDMSSLEPFYIGQLPFSLWWERTLDQLKKNEIRALACYEKDRIVGLLTYHIFSFDGHTSIVDAEKICEILKVTGNSDSKNYDLLLSYLKKEAESQKCESIIVRLDKEVEKDNYSFYKTILENNQFVIEYLTFVCDLS